MSKRRSPGFLIAVGLILLLLAYGCGAQPTESADSSPAVTPPATVANVGVLPPTFATEVAERGTSSVVVAVAEPPFDPVQYVNSLDYAYTNVAPAMEAFRVVALTRGWPEQAITRWTPFVYDVISKESGGCWNIFGGAVMPFPADGCRAISLGSGSDAGVGQITSSGHGPNGVVCQQEGLCGRWAVVQSPWTSTVALVVVLEDSGRFGWCDYKGAPRLHDCHLIGKDERPLP